MIASVLVAFVGGLTIGVFAWVAWVAGRRWVTVGVAVAGLLLTFMTLGDRGLFLTAIASLWGMTGGFGASASRGLDTATHLAALPVTVYRRWLVALTHLIDRPGAVLLGPLALRFPRVPAWVRPGPGRLALPPRPVRFRGLAGWYLGLGLDSERAAWAAQLARQCGLGDVLSDPMPCLDDGEVAALAVCRTLAFGAASTTLVDPTGSMTGDLRRAIDALLGVWTGPGLTISVEGSTE